MSFSENFPDAVWSRLKMWAEAQRDPLPLPTIERCVAEVRTVATDISHRLNALPPEVVEFYASETLEMILRFRSHSDRDERIDAPQA